MELSDQVVLLIDDDPELAEVLAALLAEERVRLATAADMPTALRILSETQPDAVIIEQMLFGWEAFTIVGELREAAGRNLPVVMMTGWANEEVIARARAADVDEFLIHPFFEELVEAVARVCPFRVSQADGSQ